MTTSIRMAMLGGGPGSFIGSIHKMGALVGAGIPLVAGVFSSNRERSLAAAAGYEIDPARCYFDHDEMFAREGEREDGVNLVCIATPNHLHLPAALAAISAGVHIMSDKPATATLAEALTLRDALTGARSCYALSYGYSAYPMVREARAKIAAGDIGRVRKIVVTYAQGWMAVPIEQTGNERAGWRTDPARSGDGGASADIGVHAFHLTEFLTGERVSSLVTDARPLVSGRALDDDCNVLLKLAEGQSGVLVVSQVAFGERNGLSFQVYGETGALHWAFDQADVLTHLKADGSQETVRPVSPGLRSRTPLPMGIGNGLIAPFAVLYRDLAAAISGNAPPELPGIEEGVRGMRFVETVVANSAGGHGWSPMLETEGSAR